MNEQIEFFEEILAWVHHGVVNAPDSESRCSGELLIKNVEAELGSLKRERDRLSLLDQ